MIVFPNCKINLGLDILRKRPDGYHDLETLFYPLPLYDVLEIIAVANDEFHYDDNSFMATGLPLEGNPSSNLCLKAYELVRKNYPATGAVKMHLHKTIPSGAGLGGGSADASFTLKLLNRIFELELRDNELLHFAAQLGSDCPFFILNKPCFASGKGELLEMTDIELGSYQFILVNPGIHIHTANAFSQITPSIPTKSIKQIIQQPLTTWKDELKNDFESFAFKQYPEIKKIKDELYTAGAIYASMSGSGSTVFGIFEKEKKIDVSFPAHYFIRELS